MSDVQAAKERLLSGFQAGYEWVAGADPGRVEAFESAIRADAERALAERVVPKLARAKEEVNERMADFGAHWQEGGGPLSEAGEAELAAWNEVASAIESLEALTGGGSTG